LSSSWYLAPACLVGAARLHAQVLGGSDLSFGGECGEGGHGGDGGLIYGGDFDFDFDFN